MTAIISPDGKHRHTLTRSWDEANYGRVLFVMLNPSTANAEIDDPTIRKCRGFATRWGFGSLEVVNLFSFRATKPADLWRAAEQNTPESEGHIRDAVARAKEIVVAWGEQKKAYARARIVDRILRDSETHVSRIGEVTGGGHPRHPLMLAYATPLLPWEGFR